MPSTNNINAWRYGTVGCTMSVPNNRWMVLRILAGSRGCCWFIDHQVNSGSGAVIYWRTYATLALAEADTAILAATTPAAPLLTVYPMDASKPLSSSVYAGCAAALPAAVVGWPGYAMRDAGTAANGFFHQGATRMEPRMWLAPNNVLHVTTSISGVVSAWYESIYLKEPDYSTSEALDT